MRELFTLRGWLYALLATALIVAAMGACERVDECPPGHEKVEKYLNRERLVGNQAYVDVVCFDFCEPDAAMGLGETP